MSKSPVRGFVNVQGTWIRLPQTLWVHPDRLSREFFQRMYGTCKRYNKSHCINSNYVRGTAKLLGRYIRSPNTYGGQLHWSELVEDSFGNQVWVMFVADLDPKYAKRVDDYDSSGAHFSPPKRDPFGPVTPVQLCVERIRTAEERADAQERYMDRIRAGEITPAAKMRQPQHEAALKRKRDRHAAARAQWLAAQEVAAYVRELARKSAN